MATLRPINSGGSNMIKYLAIVFLVAAFSHLIVGVLIFFGLMRQPIIELLISPAWIYHAISMVVFLLIALVLVKHLKKK